MESEEKGCGLLSGVIQLLIYIAATFIIVLFLNKYIVQQTVVSGESMYDTLADGDRIIINKFGTINRYDIVVFELKDDVYFIKRVYGLPGEKVRIDEEGHLYINGLEIEDPYKTEPIFEPGIAVEEITLSEDEYFLIGDNRNNSADSRNESIGPVKADKIIGKAWCRIYPVGKAGRIE